MPLRVKKIVSGGQTGADRAGLDAALELGLETGGWIPKGRRAEDGRIPVRYRSLRETATADYAERTEANVRDSDATIVVGNGPLDEGSLLTFQLAKRLRKPVLKIDLGRSSVKDAAADLRQWLVASDCEVLNVAGPRASSDPTVYELTRRLLKKALILER